MQVIRYFTLAALLTAGWKASSQEQQQLVMSWADVARGTQSATFLLSDISHLSFNADDGTMTITARDGATTTLSCEQAWQGCFANDEASRVNVQRALHQTEVLTLSGMPATKGNTTGVCIVKTSDGSRKKVLTQKGEARK